MRPDDYTKTKAEFTAYLESKGYTRNGIESRLAAFDQYRKWMEKENLHPTEVSYTDLLLFMKYCKRKEISQRTIKHYLTIVRHYYDHLIEAQQIDQNPALDIQVKGVRRKVLYHILEPTELHQLYHRYPAQTIKDRRNRVILGLLVYQGLQTAELAKLEVSDIKLREGIIDVPGSVKSNGRVMQLEAHQVMDLYDYVLKVRQELIAMPSRKEKISIAKHERLFIHEGGSYLYFGNMMAPLLTTLRKINPSVENARQLRASVIVKWLKQHNLRQVQYLAGHRYISSTESYQQNDMEGLKEEVQQYHPFG